MPRCEGGQFMLTLQILKLSIDFCSLQAGTGGSESSASVTLFKIIQLNSLILFTEEYIHVY